LIPTQRQTSGKVSTERSLHFRTKTLRSALGVLKAVKPETIHAVVRRTVEVFLSGYQRRWCT
jgi:hypothetical protein